MNKLLKLSALLIVSIFGLWAIMSAPTFAASNPICSQSGISSEVRAAAGCGGNAGGELKTVIPKILEGVIGISALIAVIFVIVGGVQYMSSAGDTSKTEKAKKTILYACIGLIVCALSFAIVQFVVKSVLQQ